jgi:copper type II ascorbate-dependent monooxygenase-like protein
VFRGGILFFVLVCACSGDRPSASLNDDAAWEGRFAVASVPGREAYLCFGFPAYEGVGERAIRRIEWSPPDGGGVVFHHAKLYAAPAGSPAGPWACEGMPEGAVGLHVWAPGGAALTMPEGIGLAVPAGTESLVVEAHAVRASDEPGRPGSVRLALWSRAPVALAAWLPIEAPVPILRPGQRQTSSGSCHVRAPTSVLFAWPHMHLRGIAVKSRVVDPDGVTSPLVDVVPWDFHNQRVYALGGLPVAPADVIELACTWQVDGADYVFSGTRTVDEMCGEGLIVSPPTSSRCAL